MTERTYLVAFDMDGTLLTINSSWEFIHRLLGTMDIATTYRRMYERGEIDYRKWAELDVSTWRGKDFSLVLREIQFLELTEHSREAVSLLKEGGFIVGVISSGLDVIAERVCRELEMDFCRSAKLEIVNGEVVGIAEELAPEAKGEVLAEISEHYGIPLSRVSFVGDGDSDLSIFQMDIGMKIAFRPKSKLVIELAHHVVEDLLEAAKILLAWKGSKLSEV